MRWIGLAVALGLGVVAVQVEPFAASLTLIAAALGCLLVFAPWRSESHVPSPRS